MRGPALWGFPSSWGESPRQTQHQTRGVSAPRRGGKAGQGRGSRPPQGDLGQRAGIRGHRYTWTSAHRARRTSGRCVPGSTSRPQCPRGAPLEGRSGHARARPPSEGPRGSVVAAVLDLCGERPAGAPSGRAAGLISANGNLARPPIHWAEPALQWAEPTDGLKTGRGGRGAAGGAGRGRNPEWSPCAPAERVRPRAVGAGRVTGTSSRSDAGKRLPSEARPWGV